MKEFRPERGRVSRTWRVVQIDLGVLAIAMSIVLVTVSANALAASNEPLGPRASIVAAVGASWLWICVTLFGALRSRASWVRGSSVTLHILLFAASTGVLQGLLGPDVPSEPLGWGGVALALIGFFASVLARPESTDQAHSDGSGADPDESFKP